jgi:hypothetical protein
MAGLADGVEDELLIDFIDRRPGLDGSGGDGGSSAKDGEL